MHRIDSASASSGLFTGGSPAYGTPPTAFTPSWCNDIQETLAAVIETAGIELEKGVYGQLVDALRELTRAETQIIPIMGFEFFGSAAEILKNSTGEVSLGAANTSALLGATVQVPVGAVITGLTIVMRRYYLQGTLTLSLEENAYSPPLTAVLSNGVIVVDGSNNATGLQVISSGQIAHQVAPLKPILAQLSFYNEAAVSPNALVAAFVSYLPPPPTF